MKLYNKNGTLTIYGLSCGYIERNVNETRIKTLEVEHSHIHVKSVLVGTYERTVWEVFEINELTKARKLYKTL